MKRIKLLLASLLIVVSAGFASAQNITVKGIVTDAKTGEPIPFASVQLKGTATGVAADIAGNYTFKVPGNGTLIFSSIGYINLEVPVNNRTTIDAAINPDAQTLDDVLVVAYGTVRREAKTGSVSSVKGATIGEVPVTSVDKMLGGKMAGVQISSYSGQPGSPTSIRIRGISSINAGTEPLWVVDGIAVIADDQSSVTSLGSGGGSTLNAINPNDIESITVLKDAAAASLYGSRAANGVILVTTKGGKEGKSSITARAKFGISTLANDNSFNAMSGEQLYNYFRVAATNRGYNPDNALLADGTTANPYYYPASILEKPMTDWMDHFTRQGVMQEYEVNATGGNSKSSYYSSLSYHKEEGIFYGVDYQRFTGRINADYQLLPKLRTGTKINLAYSNQNGIQSGKAYYSNPAYSGYSILPWTAAYDANGNHNVNIPENSNANARAQAKYDDYNDKLYRLQGNMYLQYNPIKQITIKTTNGVESSWTDSRQYWAPETNEGEATLWTYRYKSYKLTTSNTVSYDDVFAEKHSVRVLVGQEAIQDHFDYLGGKSPKVDPDIPYPPTASADKDQVFYGESEESMLSFFGSADYNFDSKYYLQGTIRYDGSSLFGADNQWGLFWSASASWNIHRENWFKGMDWLNTLKLRASYGVNGNNNIGRYAAYGVYATSEYSGVVGMLPSRPANPNLSWEKNKTWNIGLDFGFWGRLNGSIDVYNKLTDDMLLSKSVPQTTGFGSRLENIGSIRNRGVEFMVDGDIIQTKDITWSAGFNISLNRSKVLDLAGSGFLTATDPRSDESTPVRIVEGKSMYNFYIRDWYGVNPSTGAGLWWTEDGKLTSNRSKARYIYAGSPEPKFNGGFNTSFTWKGLTLSAFFEFVYGNDVMYSNWYLTDGNKMSNNYITAELNYWKQPGDTGTNPKPIAGNPGIYHAGYSTRFMQDGSYLRIKDITLAYMLPTSITNKIGIKNIKVYASATNPYTFHDVTAFDPEFGPLGYDYGGTYPLAKSFIGGIEVTF